MKQRLLTTLLLILSIGVAAIAQTQQKTKFAIASFGQDPFDQTPTNPEYEKVDGSGARYAIIKVTSTNPEDDLKAYRFNFGNLNSLTEVHNGQLWVYVQRNAKLVTISREGYQTIDKHDLGLTIEAGKTYIMQLASAGVTVANQMVMFNVSPANSQASIMIKSDKVRAREEEFGTINTTGMVGKSLPLGSYTYRVVASGFNTSEGRLTLTDKSSMHIEPVKLTQQGMLSVTSEPEGAKLYLNGKFQGLTPYKAFYERGDYKLKLKFSKALGEYKSLKEDIHINVDEEKSLNYTLKNKIFLKPTTGYVFAPFFIGFNNILGVNAGIGVYIHNFNFEVNIPWHFWWSYESNNYELYEIYELTREGGIPGIDLKVGYGFIPWYRFRITPQFGYSLFRAHYGTYEWISNGSSTYERISNGNTFPIHAFTLGARMEMALARHIGFFLTPIVQFRVKNNDLLKHTDEISAMGEYGKFALTAKNLKNLGRGFYVQMGLYFSL